MKMVLPMYIFEELKPAIAAWSSAVQRHAATLGLDDEGVVLSQTCGWPLVTSDRGLYKVVAVPRYDAAGCDGARYSSAMVASRECVPEENCVFAVNDFSSCSGYLLPCHWLGAERVMAMERERTTGSHWASACQVR